MREIQEPRESRRPLRVEEARELMEASKVDGDAQASKVSNCVGALFIHGTASSGRVWARLLSSRIGRRAPGRRGARAMICGRSAGVTPTLGSILDGPVLTPDIPGMGDAQVPMGVPLSFDYWLAYFRDMVGGRPMHLVGHSLGAAIAVHLAQEPWAVSITLISPATSAYCEQRRQSSEAGMNSGSVVFAGPLGRMVSDSGALSRDEAKMLREDYAKAASLRARGVPWPPFPKIEASYLRGKQVLLIYGEEDGVVPSRYFRLMLQELESASLDIRVQALPCCGHIPQLERPEEVAHALVELWDLVSDFYRR